MSNVDFEKWKKNTQRKENFFIAHSKAIRKNCEFANSANVINLEILQNYFLHS